MADQEPGANQNMKRFTSIEKDRYRQASSLRRRMSCLSSQGLLWRFRLPDGGKPHPYLSSFVFVMLSEAKHLVSSWPPDGDKPPLRTQLANASKTGRCVNQVLVFAPISVLEPF